MAEATDVEKLVVQLSADFRSYENAMAKATGLTKAELKKLKAEAANIGSSAGAGFTAAMRGAGATQMRAQIQGASFQIADFAVQVQGGTSAVTALAQQLPQVLGMFGAIGAVLGAGVAIGIPAVALAFRLLGEESLTVKERLDVLGAALTALNAAAEIQGLSIEKLTEKYGAADAEVQTLIASIAQLSVDKGLSDVESLKTSFSEFTDLSFFQVAADGVGEISTGVANLVDQFDLTLPAAQALQNAMLDLAGASGLDETFSALTAIIDAINSATTETGETNTEMNTLRETVNQLAKGVGEIRGRMDEVTDATGNATIAAQNLRNAYIQAADAIALARSQEKARLQDATSGLAATEDSRNSNDRGIGLTYQDRQQLDTSQGGFRPVKVAGGGGGGGSAGLSAADKADEELLRAKKKARSQYFADLDKMREENERREVEANQYAADSFADLFTDAISGAKSFEDSIKSLLGQLGQLLINKAFLSLFTGGGFGSSSGGNFLSSLIQGRASGGPVTAGTPYIVGEKRPELFVPDQNGTIIPKVPRSSGSAQSSGAVHVTVGVSADNNGNLLPFVQSVAQANANRVRKSIPSVVADSNRRS